MFKINSPQEFYNLIKDIELDNSIIPFFDRMELFLYGCACESENYWNQAVNEYKKLKNSNFNTIKEIIGESKISFYLEDLFLFEV
jgi:hypothetical protein